MHVSHAQVSCWHCVLRLTAAQVPGITAHVCCTAADKGFCLLATLQLSRQTQLLKFCSAHNTLKVGRQALMAFGKCAISSWLPMVCYIVAPICSIW
jgi:hypothetical protein